MPRGRPKGSKNKSNNISTPIAVTDASKQRGRPPGSKNKAKVVVPPPSVPTPVKRGRGRPAASVTTPSLPRAENFPEPLRGFQAVMAVFNPKPAEGMIDKGYLIYTCMPKMNLLPEDMAKAIEKYQTIFAQLPTRVILNQNNEKLLPFLHAQLPDLQCGLTLGGAAMWEIKFQIP